MVIITSAMEWEEDKEEAEEEEEERDDKEGEEEGRGLERRGNSDESE